eukprot:scaffold154103_cov31-Prasinocladus_malaysianus.AAC.1
MDMTTAGMEWEASICNDANICKGRDIAEKAVKYYCDLQGQSRCFQEIKFDSLQRTHSCNQIYNLQFSRSNTIITTVQQTYLDPAELTIYRHSALQKDRMFAIASHDNR